MHGAPRDAGRHRRPLLGRGGAAGQSPGTHKLALKRKAATLKSPATGKTACTCPRSSQWSAAAEALAAL
eukprot:388138-Lingulodinium_polyedra.AAC.1